MSYVDHIEPEHEAPKKRWSIDMDRVTKVTTFSKLLALILFILLPFGGFWLGTQQTSVSYVEAPVRGEETRDTASVDTDVDEVGGGMADGDGGPALREYVDHEAGLSFAYPVEWGVVSVGVEAGECPDTYTDDTCTMRTYSIQDPASGQRAVFLVAATAGHGFYPMPRGAFWGDFAHAQNEAWQTLCAQQSTQCALIENAAGLSIAAHSTGAVIDASILGEEATAGWYYTEVSNTNYTRFVLSPVELGWVTTETASFADTVVHTLDLER